MEQRVIPYSIILKEVKLQRFHLFFISFISLLLHILHNPVSCGADGLLGDAHDAADVAVVHAHLVEDEEGGIVGGLGSVFLLDVVKMGNSMAL